MLHRRRGRLPARSSPSSASSPHDNDVRISAGRTADALYHSTIRRFPITISFALCHQFRRRDFG